MRWTEEASPTRKHSLLRTLCLEMTVVTAVIALLCGIMVLGNDQSNASSEAAVSVPASEVAEPSTGDNSLHPAGEPRTVDISTAQPISAFSDYWTCVGMVGGQIAYFLVTKQFWMVPPWVWPKVRQACWSFINS